MESTVKYLYGLVNDWSLSGNPPAAEADSFNEHELQPQDDVDASNDLFWSWSILCMIIASLLIAIVLFVRLPSQQYTPSQIARAVATPAIRLYDATKFCAAPVFQYVTEYINDRRVAIFALYQEIKQEFFPSERQSKRAAKKQAKKARGPLKGGSKTDSGYVLVGRK